MNYFHLERDIVLHLLVIKRFLNSILFPVQLVPFYVNLEKVILYPFNFSGTLRECSKSEDFGILF